jgi:lipopolysaccharide transport system ATP-binding protein
VSELLLQLTDVGKAYPNSVHSSQRLRAFWQILRHGHCAGGVTVIEGINFEVHRGQSMAIIGANGAGKSTLLKIITGVLAPSRGKMRQQGTRAALLELGAGFDPDYSGMDNLRMNASFLGLDRRQVDERLDDILAFADIGDSIHEPVKHYSSGMVVRLGFAVVASVSPDLLITDEVLAVGDESFQKKCIRWIEDYLARGGTLLMVSHNMYQVQKLCRHALWLEGGRARMQGDVFDVTQGYLAWHERQDAASSGSARASDAAACYTVASLRVSAPGASERVQQPMISIGETLKIIIAARSPDGRPPVVMVGLVRADGTSIYGVGTDVDEIRLEAGPDGLFNVCLAFESLALLPGGYVVRAHAMDPEGLRVQDTVEQAFTVTGRTREQGFVRLQHRWEKM